MVRFIDRHYGLIIKPGERGHYNGIYLRVAQSDDVWPEIINCLDSRRGALMRRFSERQTVTDVSAALPTRMLDNRPLVLAAVDLPENRLAAKSVLESRSRLTLVNDAVSALQLMISKRFDLVYLQFSLPASLDKVESRLFWLSQQRQSGNLAMVQAGGHGFGLASIFRGVSYRLRK